jgi:hypothetical protein
MPAETYRSLTRGVKWDVQKEVLSRWLKDNAKEEGWHINAYLGSQKSIIGSGYGDVPVILNFHYYRYVESQN